MAGDAFNFMGGWDEGFLSVSAVFMRGSGLFDEGFDGYLSI